MSDRVFKVFMGLITALAMAVALDYLVHGITFNATPNPACSSGLFDLDCVSDELRSVRPWTEGEFASIIDATANLRKSQGKATYASLIGRFGSSAFRLSAASVSMSLTGSRFSSKSAPRPFHCGIRG